MKTDCKEGFLSRPIWGRLTVLVATAALLAACGGSEPTPTPVPPTPVPPTATSAPAATTAPTVAPTAASAAESPLAQPASPLAAPESPLQTPGVSLASPTTPAAAAALAAQLTISEPVAGKGSLGFVLYSTSLHQGIPRTGYYMTAAVEDNGKFIPPPIYLGPKLENGDYAGASDQNGVVRVDNVPPGHYYLMVWSPYTWLNTFDKTDESYPVLITVNPGEKSNLGVLYTDWP